MVFRENLSPESDKHEEAPSSGVDRAMSKTRLRRLVDAFLSVRESWGAVALDRDIIYISNVTGIPLPWRARQGEGGWRHDLLLPWRRRVGGLSSGSGRLFIASDFEGDERWAIYEVKGLEAVKVAGEDGSMNLLGPVSPLGVLAFTGNKRNGVDFDLYLYKGDSEPVLAARLEGINVAGEWIDDKVVVIHRNTNLDSDLYLVDPERGRVEPLTEHRGEAANGSPVYVGGGWLLYSSNEGSEFASLRALNVETGERFTLYDPGMDLEALALSGNVLYASFNKRGRSLVAWGPLSFETGKPSWRPTGSLELGWVVSRIEAYPGSHAVVSASSAALGTDVYLLGRGSLERITWSPKLGLEGEFVEPTDFHYRSFDGLEIHMLYYKPRRPAKEPPPAVIWLHGGPESQARPAFNPVVQAILSLGIAVAAPNFRGSTGYGKTFTHLDDVEKRMDAVRDVAEAVKSLAEKGLVDPQRLCAMGGSYGGYLTLMTLAVNPELWRCGVEIVGIFNLVTFIRNTSPYRRRYRITEYGDPDKHGEIMLKLSPATHADKIKAPLLVIHGARDPRVPVSEAEQLVEQLRSRGIQVEYLRFDDEGHGIAKLENRLQAYTKALEFIAKHLLDH